MKICVMGAGVGGLTAAHKLAKEGHEVHIYEKNAEVGGQARSRYTSDGEHSEYCLHLTTNTSTSLLTLLREIPVENGSMIDRLKLIEQHAFGIGENFIIEQDTPMSSSASTVLRCLSKLKLNITKRDMAKMLAFHLFARTATPERFEKYDTVYLKDLMRSVSPGLQRYAVDHLASQLGQDPSLFNVHTILNLTRPTNRIIDSDRVRYYRFNGPMNQQWFEPWVEYIKSLGASLYLNTAIKKICCEGEEIKEIVIKESSGEERHLQYDYYVNSLSVHGFAQALNGADKTREKMIKLSNMSIQLIVQFTLSFKEKLTFGGPSLVLFPDSPWQISFANESSYWDVPLSKGDSPPGEVLPLVIGSCHCKGILYDKMAIECTEEELMNEAWAQMKQNPRLLKQFKTSDGRTLNDIHCTSYNLWYTFGYSRDTGTMTTSEPKFGNNVGTLALRPPTHQKELNNLVHANAYVKTEMVSVTMESAVEAGVRAANYIKSGRAEADVVRFRHPGWIWGPCQFFDYLLFKLGLPNVFEVLLNWM